MSTHDTKTPAPPKSSSPPPDAPKDVRVEEGVVYISTEIPVTFGGGT